MLQHALQWFEIPLRDYQRGKSFYEAILDRALIENQPSEELKMAIFPTDTGAVAGALSYNPEFYTPSAEGTTVYLNANPDLQIVLDRVEAAGGKVVMSKRLIREDIGYMALILDSEGNRVGLMSQQ